MRCFAGCAMAVMFLVPVAPLAAQEGRETQIERRVQFNRAVVERDRLHLQLEELDQRAADRLVRNEDPVKVYAEQMAVQDRLDRLELRLDVLALRHGFTIPPLPGAGADDDASANPDADGGAAVFDRGRVRAQRTLHARYDQFLASIDFDGFLAHAE